ncbi:conserved hypothetical protein [Leishmania infantum JPCM5]|uniref:Uncharacterized protein n=2 Tax=Leishmania infantum TaxID=5671 RepID=A4IDC7_LEIIN|nr:conserved hypothetical protein [Leishmania infantum JPCM5]CAC9549730.1 hypothetical_protein_-_conserved [Leishmania infantum]CAM72858.1 conserved hypothetical protein [Leishmania infantum JPCM5]SUZ46536.1 hypothetical_protein_-_conserved [Leishmania infantum]|eukprot:XP_001469746.1 conserved hypothetical protein [Leishmania infantum JPCM5]
MAGYVLQTPFPATRLAPPSSPLGASAAHHSILLRRQALRPVSAEEDARLFDDLPMPCFSASQHRTVSPTKHDARKAGLEVSRAVFTDASLQMSPGTAINNSVRVSSLRSGSAGLGESLHVPPLSAFEHPDAWLREYAFLRAKLKRPADSVTVYHDYAAPLNSRATMRHACVVHPLPDLEKVQEALRRRFQAHAPATSYDVCEQQYAADSCAPTKWDDDAVSMAAAPETADAVRGAHREQRNDMFLPPATLWCVGGSSYENEIVVRNTVTGQRLLRILDPKMRVAVTALQHAPFRGFMKTHQLHVLPVREPHDVLRLKASQLVFTDYMWCGLQDGSVRLVPANHHHIRACGASSLFSKAPSAALVYELPRYQGGAIVSIVCSPCHDAACAFGDSPKWGLPNRLSNAIQCMTAVLSAGADSAAAAGQADGEPVDPASRQHLSLVCIAATDASVVIWDVRQVYEAVATAQQQRQEQNEGTHISGASVFRHGAAGPLTVGGTATSGTPFCFDASASLSGATGVSSDVITFDCSSPVPGLQNMQVRSSCTLIQVKPLARLSGGFAGLTALRWVSSLVVAGGCDAAASRHARMAARDPCTVPCRGEETPRIELTQTKTRFDKREEQRGELELTEEEMQGVERELEHMMPPLAAEPAQSLRVNLLVASDCMGTVHLWNLDEELHRCSEVKESALGWPASSGAFYYSSLRSMSSRSDGRSAASHGSGASQPTSGISNASARRTSASKGHGGTRRSDRVPKSRRACRGLGLAEARENRARLSELPSNRPTLGHKCDGEAATIHKNLQRPSIGRSSTEEHDSSQSAQGRSPQPTAEREGGRLSDGHGTVPALPASHKSLVAPSATVQQHPPLHNALPPNHPSSAKNAVPVSGPVKAKKLKKSRNPVHETSASMFRSSLQSTSPSRGSAHRPSTSPCRLSESRHPAQPQTGMHSRASVQRGASITARNACGTGSGGQDLLMPTQAAKCQIRFGQGAAAAIADVAVDLPPCIRTTLRRIPKPSNRVASWQHRPTEEEVDSRILENEFEELTEEKALFFAFQRLEMYVAVDGAMSTVRCVPQWLLPDEDEQELFRQRNSDDWREAGGDLTTQETTGAAVRGWMAEAAMPDRVSMGAFDLHLRKRLLDVHAQPITQLFLDPWQGLLWVAREDGFASIFATRDKSVVSRMPHPSADALLAPPSAQEWAKLQEQALTRSHPNDARAANGFGLECHKECRDLPPTHLTQVLPIAVRRQRALLLGCSAAGGCHDRRSDCLAAATVTESPGRSCQRTLALAESVAARDPPKSSALKLLPSLSCSSDTTKSNSGVFSAPRSCDAVALVCVDGRSDMKNLAKSREAQQWRWLRQLQLCRAESAAVCQAQRHRYYALCEAIGRKAVHVIQELGHYAIQSRLRTYFHLWKDHLALFHHTHLMRRQRTARLERERALARRLECARMAQVRGAYYARWQRLLAGRKCRRQEEALTRFARAAATVSHGRRTSRGSCCRGPLPTAAMMGRFHRLSALRACWRTWQAWADTKRLQRHRHKDLNALQEYPPPLSRTRSLTSLAASMATTPRCVVSGHRGCADGVAAEGTTAPFHSIHSGGVYVRAASLSSPQGSAYRPTASGRGAATPPSARTPGLTEAVPTAPPPALEVLLAELLRARVFVFHFSDARSSATSVLDESWSVILENAESGAETDDDDDRRFSVFRFALLPLLQGLISTAEEVLPNLFNESVAEEVLSMLVGIVLAMDYVTANAEGTWWTLREAAVLTGCSAFVDGTEPMRSAFDASLLVLRAYAVRAFALDPEAAEVLRGLAKGKKVLAQFLDFAMERAVARRMEHL